MQHLRITLALLTLLAPLAVCGLALPATAAVTAQAAAPDFTLKSAEGRNLRLREQRGQVVLVNFWASWCGPCKQEMPHLNRIYDKYRSSGFTLLAVNIDDDARHGAATAVKWGLKFPVLLDAEKSVTRLYDLGAMPATVLIDRDGQVRYLHRGYREGVEEAYERQVRELVKE